ncbi:MAG: SprT-like domain-containing protein [Pseudomonadota bacterium]
MNPGHQSIALLARAYIFFNEELFEGKLKTVHFTLQRKARTFGYYSPDRWQANRRGSNDDELVDEIAMNPAYFKSQSTQQILSTLVHEMVHHWQRYFGKPGRGQYHNVEWAKKMESIGLFPSDTGEPGGKRTGDRMSHYIVPGREFDVACGKFINMGHDIPWFDCHPPKEAVQKRSSDKATYECPTLGCDLKVWGKPGIQNLGCTVHKTLLKEKLA